MGKHSYRLSAASVKNLRGVLLAALASALIFLFSGVVFQSSFYAVPLLALITLPLAIAATNAAWRAASACVAVLVFSLLEFTVNAGATPLSPIFAVYAACIFTTIALIGGGLYWRIRAERDSYSEQSARERSISALSTELLRRRSYTRLRSGACSASRNVPQSFLSRMAKAASAVQAATPRACSFTLWMTPFQPASAQESAPDTGRLSAAKIPSVVFLLWRMERCSPWPAF
mgnify:CR=1 FL=1